MSSGKMVQRTVVYLGEVNDTQRTAWLKTLDVEFVSRRPRDAGARGRSPPGEAERAGTATGARVRRLLVGVRAVVDSAMDELLDVDFAVAEKDRLYRCLDRLLAHTPDLCVWRRQQWADLFHADFDVLLYDLTSTYVEGKMEQNPTAKRGYSRDGHASQASGPAVAQTAGDAPQSTGARSSPEAHRRGEDRRRPRLRVCPPRRAEPAATRDARVVPLPRRQGQAPRRGVARRSLLAPLPPDG